MTGGYRILLVEDEFVHTFFQKLSHSRVVESYETWMEDKLTQVVTSKKGIVADQWTLHREFTADTSCHHLVRVEPAGPDAVEHFQDSLREQDPYRVVLLDLNLGSIDRGKTGGLALYRKMAEEAGRFDIRFIIYTGDAGLQDDFGPLFLSSPEEYRTLAEIVRPMFYRFNLSEKRGTTNDITPILASVTSDLSRPIVASDAFTLGRVKETLTRLENTWEPMTWNKLREEPVGDVPLKFLYPFHCAAIDRDAQPPRTPGAAIRDLRAAMPRFRERVKQWVESINAYDGYVEPLRHFDRRHALQGDDAYDSLVRACEDVRDLRIECGEFWQGAIVPFLDAACRRESPEWIREEMRKNFDNNLFGYGHTTYESFAALTNNSWYMWRTHVHKAEAVIRSNANKHGQMDDPEPLAWSSSGEVVSFIVKTNSKALASQDLSWVYSASADHPTPGKLSELMHIASLYDGRVEIVLVKRVGEEECWQLGRAWLTGSPWDVRRSQLPLGTYCRLVFPVGV